MSDISTLGSVRKSVDNILPLSEELHRERFEASGSREPQGTFPIRLERRRYGLWGVLAGGPTVSVSILVCESCPGSYLNVLCETYEKGYKPIFNPQSTTGLKRLVCHLEESSSTDISARFSAGRRVSRKKYPEGDGRLANLETAESWYRLYRGI